MRILLILPILLFIITSCDMQKRKYRNGFYLERSHTVKTEKQTDKKTDQPSSTITNAIASSENGIVLLPEPQEELIHTIRKETVCDTLIMGNGVKMIVKVSDVDKEKIHYYLCDSENQAEFYIETSKIKKICYANGLTDELKNPKDASYDYSAAQNQYNQNTIKKSPELERARKNANTSLALVLSGLFFGPIMIAGFIMAHNAKRKLKNQPGYESSYRLANTLSIIGYVILGLFAFIIFLAIVGALL